MIDSESTNGIDYDSREASAALRPTCVVQVIAVTTTTSTSTTTTTTTSTTTTTPRFVDNGDGTVTDTATGLQWEQKVAGSGCLHCVDDTYSWSDSESSPDGSAFRFLAKLNGGTTGIGNCVSDADGPQSGGFANHCDWRLPTLAELLTIADTSSGCHGVVGPCIDPTFGPTASVYWSSTTHNGGSAFSGLAWLVSVDPPGTGAAFKITLNSVRAVRGGS